MRTRYEERRKKRRQNLILNSLIGIVLFFIVVVGIQLISNPSSQSESSQAHGEKRTAEQSETDGTESEETNHREEDNDVFNRSETDGEYTFVDGGPSGPWHPIGTKQTGEHVTTYEKDSLDWQEMEMAMAYGAGIERDKMIVLWIGNGGDPQRAKGKVKSSDDPNTIYNVLIEWVDEKGWKPIEVAIEQ